MSLYLRISSPASNWPAGVGGVWHGYPLISSQLLEGDFESHESLSLKFPDVFHHHAHGFQQVQYLHTSLAWEWQTGPDGEMDKWPCKCLIRCLFLFFFCIFSGLSCCFGKKCLSRSPKPGGGLLQQQGDQAQVPQRVWVFQDVWPLKHRAIAHFSYYKN